jgi:hypothetical protein
VVIARPQLRPQDIADPHLFVHLDLSAPAMAAASPPPAKIVKTAQTSNDRQTTDVPGATKDAVDAPAIEPTVDANAVAGHGKVGGATDTVNAAGSAQSSETEDTRSAALTPEAPAAAPVSPNGPIEILHASKSPISIFISRKAKKIYVRQDFTPLFEADITIERPEERFGTHVFTAMDYLPDRAAFHWNVISLPGELPPAPRKAEPAREWSTGLRRTDRGIKQVAEPPPPQTPQQALARIIIPRDVADRISRLMSPGSSLIVSDQGLGDETGEGTDFVIVAR